MQQAEPVTTDQAVTELCKQYAKSWQCAEPMPPTGSTLARIRSAMNLPDGMRKSLAAIRGHHKAATAPGSQNGKEMRHAFPPFRNDAGNTIQAKLDLDRFEAFAVAGGFAGLSEDAKRIQAKKAREQAERQAEADQQDAEISALLVEHGMTHLKGQEKFDAIRKLYADRARAALGAT